MNNGSLFRSLPAISRHLLLGIAVVALAFPHDRALGTEQDATAGLPPLTSIIPELRRGGFVIYFRHAATDHSSDDVDIDFSRCETQRTLSETGRRQAVDIGRAFDTLEIPVGEVIASPFCRCKNTAELAFGHYQVNPDLYFAISVGKAERERLAGALRTMLATRPEPGFNTVVVAHTANLKEAVGIWPKPEGVAYIFRPESDGGFSLAAQRVLPEDWVRLSGVAAANP